MHPSAERLYQAAQVLKRTSGQSAVARLLNESPQVVKNWETRGVSDGGAIAIEATVGALANWIKTGNGPMTAAGEATRASAPPALDQALAMVLDALVHLPAVRWPSVRAQLDQVVAHPEMVDEVAQELLSMLQTAPRGKRAGAA